MTNSHYRWVIVAAGGLLGCVAIGAMFSLPVFLLPISQDTGWSVTGVSSAMTIGFIAMALASMAWGTLSDRFGPRPVVLIGSVVLAASLALASRATSLLAVPAHLRPAGRRRDRRDLRADDGLRDRLVRHPSQPRRVAGLRRHGHGADDHVAVRRLARLHLRLANVAADHRRRSPRSLMIPVALLVRRPPALEGERRRRYPDGEPQSAMSVGQALRSPQFIILLLTNFFCCATHSGPIFHTVSYAVTCGIPMIAAVTIYSVEGLAGMGGRVAFGILGDRLGAKRVLVAGLLLQAFGALAYVFVRELGAFYAVAALFGFIYAGIMPLYAVLARENFPLRMMGTVIGGTAMAGSLGMATGPLAGGLIYDTFASYSWLYIGSWGIGIGAFLIAMMFRPFPRLQTAAQPIPA